MINFVKRHKLFSLWIASFLALTLPVFHGTSNEILLTIQGIFFLIWIGGIWVFLGSVVYFLQNLTLKDAGKHFRGTE